MSVANNIIIVKYKCAIIIHTNHNNSVCNNWNISRTANNMHLLLKMDTNDFDVNATVVYVLIYNTPHNCEAATKSIICSSF